ncbi:hypothetical protein ECDEC5B_5539 [Escherichia coli DEC5B]|nr:hypothetical protein ECDEC5B_5539 [Escherichia coli DEC5B]
MPDGCCMFRCSGLPAFRLNYLQETCIIQKKYGFTSGASSQK